jgi:LuxR family maltose regulon positive regulatory protein
VARVHSPDALTAGRAALARGAWEQARLAYVDALAGEETGEALEGLSWAAWWLDDVDACFDLRERAYRGYRGAGDLRGAARLALWLGDDYLEFRGEQAVANGWTQRAARLLEELGPAPEHGWLAVFEAHAALGAGDTAGAQRLAAEARALGHRLHVVDLEMFAVATEGAAMVAEGRIAEGMRRLDEAAAAALSGEYEDLRAAGWTCCYLIAACERVRDFDRAAQWCREAEAFSRRLDIRFVTGVCRTHYGAVLCWRGEWDEAERVLVSALEELTTARPAWRSDAVVRLAELRRRQGRLDEAGALFAEVERHPLAELGRAELSLARGAAELARASLERLLRRIPVANPAARAGPVEALVRAEAAAGNHAAAAGHARELRAIADTIGTTPLLGAASFAAGVLAAATGDDTTARDRFDDAAELFAAAGAPLERGRARLGLAEALRGLGRTEVAEHEAAAALAAFEALGAEADSRSARRRPGPLTPRELEVLRLVADGLGDRDIAKRLTVSEHTVHRHVANIHAKLRCSSRAAAVALAHRRDLL